MFDGITRRKIRVRVVLCYIFGDMPAIAKAMKFKGHNGKSPCRTCELQGTLDPNSRYYFPLKETHVQQRPAGGQHVVLPLRTDDRIAAQIARIESAPSTADALRLQTEFGISGPSIFLELPYFSITNGFPLDAMHLIGNICRQLYRQWTGEKSSASGCVLPRQKSVSYSEITVKGSQGIPAAFGRSTRSIEKHIAGFKAEEWSNFLLRDGPLALAGLLPDAHYRLLVTLSHAVILATCINWKVEYVSKVKCLLERFVLDFQK